ncbi:MAG: NlpC/P60 family protein [Alphaproteobacteria bacterium]
MDEQFRLRVITEARSWIGTPYHHAASRKGIGCDCLGLIRGIWRAVIGEEPEIPEPYRAGWIDTPGEERLRDAARRHLIEILPSNFCSGDILMFRWRDHLPAKHLGLATSDKTMVHAHEGASVAEVDLGHWRKRLVYAFRLPRPINLVDAS